EENGGGKRALAGRKRERGCERDLRACARKGDLFFLVRIRLRGGLRADQIEKLVRALKIQLLLGAILRPASADDRLCGVECAVINAAHHGNFKMKGGVLLANVDCWQTTHTLVMYSDGGHQDLLTFMPDVPSE